MESPNHNNQLETPTKGKEPAIVHMQEVHDETTGKEKITPYNTSASSAQDKDLSMGYELYLVGAFVLRDRGDEIIKELKWVEPYMLSTNEKQFDNMTTVDLHKSFTDLWEIYYHQRTLVSGEKHMSVGFRNWLIIDICRRCKLLHDRFQVKQQSTSSDAKNDEPLSFDIWLHKPCHGRKYFNKNRFLGSPILSYDTRQRVLGISNAFGDAISTCTEFIDLEKITTMSNNQFQSLIQALKKHHTTIANALQTAAFQPLLEEIANEKVMGNFKPATRLT
ncbi:hypothetical protein K492DRAFT_182473 [Lichtheimia hyalospora FSU 10163]|nr:hypothetical protein K492DRAFT_182473 [Lichtheimia hyalospora FSU 10163]